MGDEPLVSPEEVASVLSSEDSDSDAAPPSATPEPSNVYSLRRPVTISADAEPFARARNATLAEQLAELFSSELDCELSIELKGFQQEQLSAAIESVSEASWVLSFSQDGAGGFALVLDPTAALTIVELALGGTGNSQAAGREPTPLETRVLNNLCKTFRPKLARATQIELAGSSFAVGKVPQRMASRGEMVGASPVTLKIGEAEHGGMLVTTVALLKPESGAEVHAVPDEIGPISRRIEQVPVEIRPVLSAGTVTLEDILGLKKDVVLKLDVAEDAPLALRVEGQQLFVGQIRRQEDEMQFEVSWRRHSKGYKKHRGTDGSAAKMAGLPRATKETA